MDHYVLVHTDINPELPKGTIIPGFDSKQDGEQFLAEYGITDKCYVGTLHEMPTGENN